MQRIPQKQDGSLTSNEQPRVLVTGGSGYVAGWVIVHLLKQGYRVRTTLRSLSREAAVRQAVASQIDSGDRLSFAPADLLKDDGWDDATPDCGYVIHVASPMGQGEPKADLVRPAREGTLRVLGAAVRNHVGRVVLTSSTIAARNAPGNGQRSPIPTDENTWTDPNERGLSEYGRSKTFAERSAWEFIEQTGQTGDLTTLTTILPGMILGPVMSGSVSGSVEVISRMLAGRVPALPRIGFSIVDVRDLAELHVKAMLSPAAAGQRFLGVGDFLWMADMARLLREHFGQAAAKVPTRRLPDIVLRLAALFQHEARFMAPLLGQRTDFNVNKAAVMLDWHPRPAAQAVIECASDLIRQHLV